MSIDSVTESVTRQFGNRFSRRSFLGRVGTGLAAIGGGALAIDTGVAFASVASCCGCSLCGASTTCGTSDCPSGTCACGQWWMCQCSGGSTLKRYRDCCAACSGGCSCGSDGRPRCLYPPPYGSCGGYTKVKCRSISCTTAHC